MFSSLRDRILRACRGHILTAEEVFPLKPSFEVNFRTFISPTLSLGVLEDPSRSFRSRSHIFVTECISLRLPLKDISASIEPVSPQVLYHSKSTSLASFSNVTLVAGDYKCVCPASSSVGTSFQPSDMPMAPRRNYLRYLPELMGSV